VILKDAGGFFDKSWRGKCFDLRQRIATRYRLGFFRRSGASSMVIARFR
jgi:hypothetical protein